MELFEVQNWNNVIQDDSDDDDDEHDHDHKRDLYARNDLLGVHISAVMVNGTTSVIVNGLGWNNQALTLTERCLYTLNYPVETWAFFYAFLPQGSL